MENFADHSRDSVGPHLITPKLPMVLDNINFAETRTPAFISEHLGDQAGAELQMTYQEEIKPVPDGASIELFPLIQ